MGKMNLNYIGIKNILGIKSLECRPGKINSIDGPNGAGKTSFLKAIKAAVGGGHDATILRNGEESGEIVLEFDNGMTLTKKVGKEKSDITLKDSSGAKVKKAASLLKDIVDTIGLNPIQLLTASQKDRVNILLESVPMELPTSRIEKEIGITIYPGDERHPIEILDSIKSDFFEKRADKNRDIKSKNGMIEQMREAVPLAEEEKDFSGEVERLEKEKNDNSCVCRVEIQSEHDKFSEGNAHAGRSLQSKIDVIRKNAEDEIQSFRVLSAKEGEGFREKMEKKTQTIHDVSGPIQQELIEKIAQAKERAEIQIKSNTAREFIENGEKDLSILESVSKSYTKKLKIIENIKEELLAGFPIKGLTVVDGDIYLDNINFDNVNEAERMRFALQVASLRESELPLICVDGLEALDHKSFELFCEEAKKTNMQFFVTRVTNDDKMSMNIIDSTKE